MSEFTIACIIAVAAAAVSFISSWAITKYKVEQLKSHVDAQEKIIQSHTVTIEKRNEELRGIHRRLDALDGLRLDATLAAINTELKHIRAILEKGD